MQLPTIHLNGSSREALKLPLCEASNNIFDAIRALAEATPNGRDYYPQGPEALARATAEHTARLRKLEEVRAEINGLLEHIDGT